MSRDVASRAPSVEGAEAVNESQTCWICLAEGTAERPVELVCKCRTRPVHRECLARWCLHNSGKSEERQCRFCYEELPDWRPTLLGDESKAEAKPLMAAVVYNNQVYKIPILPGPEGKAAFKRRVHELFGLGLSSRYEVTFECKVQADNLSLRGLNAYEAATRCAALSAQRAATTTAQPAAVDGSDAPGSPSSVTQSGEAAV